MTLHLHNAETFRARFREKMSHYGYGPPDPARLDEIERALSLNKRQKVLELIHNYLAEHKLPESSLILLNHSTLEDQACLTAGNIEYITGINHNDVLKWKQKNLGSGRHNIWQLLTAEEKPFFREALSKMAAERIQGHRIFLSKLLEEIKINGVPFPKSYYSKFLRFSSDKGFAKYLFVENFKLTETIPNVASAELNKQRNINDFNKNYHKFFNEFNVKLAFKSFIKMPNTEIAESKDPLIKLILKVAIPHANELNDAALDVAKGSVDYAHDPTGARSIWVELVNKCKSLDVKRIKLIVKSLKEIAEV